jgi:hypothetical protein
MHAGGTQTLVSQEYVLGAVLVIPVGVPSWAWTVERVARRMVVAAAIVRERDLMV